MYSVYSQIDGATLCRYYTLCQRYRTGGAVMTQTIQAPQLAELLQENARLKREIARYQETDTVQKQVIQDLRRRIEIRSISNKKMSANEKLFWDAAQELIRQETPNERGLIRLDVSEAAEKIGSSPDSGSRLLKSITERFDATHETVAYTTKTGQKCHLAYIKPDEPIWQAPQVAELSPEKTRKQGGDRRCSCGGHLQVKERTITSQQFTVCEQCGTQTIYPVREVNTPLEANYAPTDDFTDGKDEAPQVAELSTQEQPDLFWRSAKPRILLYTQVV